MTRRPTPDRSDRRRFLGLLAAASAVPAGSLTAPGCAPGERDDGAVRVALDELAGGERVLVRVRDTPVEVVRTGNGDLRAMSLLCTHFSCTVHWDEAEGRYVCPCHDGRFDAEGRPVSGPPERPLRRLPVTVADGAAWIGRG